MIRPMRQMRRSLATFGLLAVLDAAWPLAQAAEAVPPQFVGANIAQGQKYYDNLKCAACHAQRMMGSSSAMYTRADRKVHNPQQLMAFTQMCVTQLNHDLFPEEVKDIAAYLNQTYYKFK